MNESNDTTRSGPDTQEVLPPVRPPSASFLMQLFVIPMVIVLVIVGFVLFIKWMWQGGSDPEKLIAELRRSSPSSWQKALDVANLLSDPNNDELRTSDPLAAQLETMLRTELDEGSVRSASIELRTFLCSALGQMHVDRGMPELVQAVGTQKEFPEIKVRVAAAIAISRRIDNGMTSITAAQNNQKLIDALIDATKQSSTNKKREIFCAELRTVAAFCMGIIGGNESLDRLSELLSDPNRNVQFNAATGLARHGDARCVSRLLEMLDWDTPIENEDGSPVDPNMRYEVLRNGIVASAQLLRSNPSVPRTDELRAAISALREDDSLASTVSKLIDSEFKDL